MPEARRQTILKLMYLFCFLTRDSDPTTSELLRCVGFSFMCGDDSAVGLVGHLLSRYSDISDRHYWSRHLGERNCLLLGVATSLRRAVRSEDEEVSLLFLQDRAFELEE